MPIRDAAYDLVVGDGLLSMPHYPDGSSALVKEIRRVLKDDGALAMRMFTISRSLRFISAGEPAPSTTTVS